MTQSISCGQHSYLRLKLKANEMKEILCLNSLRNENVFIFIFNLVIAVFLEAAQLKCRCKKKNFLCLCL